jgi:hypothetical protein
MAAESALSAELAAEGRAAADALTVASWKDLAGIGEVDRQNHEVYRVTVTETPAGTVGVNVRGYRLPAAFPLTDTRPQKQKLSRNGKRPKVKVLRGEVPPEGMRDRSGLWLRNSAACFELAEVLARAGMALAEHEDDDGIQYPDGA